MSGAIPGPITELPILTLIPSGKILLLGSFGGRLVLSMRKKEPLDEAFLAFAAGLFALAFYPEAMQGLSSLGEQLAQWISHLGNPDGLKQLIVESLRSAAQAPAADGSATRLNLAALAEQALRTGVWGVVSAIADFIFLLAGFLLEVSRTVLWQITLFLFPLGCGLLPLLPGVFQGMLRTAVEITLWGPVLALIQVSTAAAARKYMLQAGSWGLYTVAVEILAVILILNVPKITHELLHGGLKAPGMSEYLGVVTVARMAVTRALRPAPKKGFNP